MSARDLVLVACSGGADSLALAAATEFVAPRLGLRAGAIVVDHGLQDGSAAIAATAAATCSGLGLDPVVVIRVEVQSRSGDGPEAAARTARYAALEAAAREHRAAAVLLAHTQDDQAESVLLGLLRGSGAVSLGGMPPRRGLLRRPLLEISRAITEAACVEQGLEPWSDPHNTDPAFARVRARNLLATMESSLGSGVRAGLARSAELLRADADALAALAAEAYAALTGPSIATAPAPPSITRAPAPPPIAPAPAPPPGLDCTALATLSPAIRSRVIRLAALAAGARDADLTLAHNTALDALVVDWHGQGAVALPGPIHGRRVCGRLVFAPPHHPSQPNPQE